MDWGKFGQWNELLKPAKKKRISNSAVERMLCELLCLLVCRQNENCKRPGSHFANASSEFYCEGRDVTFLINLCIRAQPTSYKQVRLIIDKMKLVTRAVAAAGIISLWVPDNGASAFQPTLPFARPTRAYRGRPLYFEDETSPTFSGLTIQNVEFNVTQMTTLTDGENSEGREQQERHHHHLYKIHNVRDDKDMWFDEQTGRFYERGSSGEAIPLATLFERAVDTVEDSIVHARRVPYEKGWAKKASKDDDSSHIPTVVVLGSGWASHALIKVADTFKMRIIVVSPVNHFVFTPSKCAKVLLQQQHFHCLIFCSNYSVK